MMDYRPIKRIKTDQSCMSAISVDTFYSSATEFAPIENQPMASHSESPIPLYRDSINGYYEFALQEHAFRFAGLHSQLTAFYTRDKDGNGKRIFVCTTHDEFWRRYKDMMPAQRYHT